MNRPSGLTTLLDTSPVIPVATIPRAEDAVPLATALLEGGIGVIEVTLRSAVALAAIEQIRRSGLEITVGAGTLWTAEQALSAIDMGAQFLVSPGLADGVHEVASRLQVPYLPGAQTASEMAVHVARGVSAVKFFPAGPAGGVEALAALSAVFPDLLFCPTGGITEASAPAYLKLRNVRCVGGSWLCARSLVESGDWSAIRVLAKRAAEIPRA